MSTIKQLINCFLAMIEVGGALRMIYCFNRAAANPDEAQSYYKKGRNLMIFMILANLALTLVFTVKKYVS